MVWWWFGVNMAGLRNIHNTNAFKFILQVFILSQKHIMGVKKVVWCGLDVVWGGLVVVWGGLGCFGVVWGVSTDRVLGSSQTLGGTFLPGFSAEMSLIFYV